MFEFSKPEKKEFESIKPGQYQGTIARADVEKTQAGHKKLKLKLKLEGHAGFHFVDLNMEHPEAKKVSMNNISSILYGALIAPPQSLATLEDICDFVKDLPVNVKVTNRIDKEGKERTNTYFNECATKLQSKIAPAKAAAGSGTAW